MYFLVDSFKFYPSLFLKGSLECTDPCGLHMQAILAFIPFSTLAKKGHFVAYICELWLPFVVYFARKGYGAGGPCLRGCLQNSVPSLPKWDGSLIFTHNVSSWGKL